MPKLANPVTEIILAPSGRYRVEVTELLKPGGWSYARLDVVRVADQSLIASIERNYSAFVVFVVKDGLEYLITGRSYMGQTIVCLDSGEQWNDPLWPNAYTGTEFCWSSCTLAPDGNTLVVEGCIWACPYEQRFYDFTSPSAGWPELTLDGVGYIDVPEKPTEFTTNGEIICFERHDSWLRLRRDGQHMRVVESWHSPARIAADAAGAQDLERYESERKSVRADARFAAVVAVFGEEPSFAVRAGKVNMWLRRKDPRASADFIWQLDGCTTVQLYDSAGKLAAKHEFADDDAGFSAALALIDAHFS